MPDPDSRKLVQAFIKALRDRKVQQRKAIAKKVLRAKKKGKKK